MQPDRRLPAEHPQGRCEAIARAGTAVQRRDVSDQRAVSFDTTRIIGFFHFNFFGEQG